MVLNEKRLLELNKNILKSMGWNANETPQERKIILKRWNKMDGRTSFHDAIKVMIREKSKSYKQGCPKSYSGEHSFETFELPKGKMSCVHCGAIKSMRKAK